MINVIFTHPLFLSFWVINFKSKKFTLNLTDGILEFC